MKQLKRNLESASEMQKKNYNIVEDSSDKEITIKMSKTTLFFVIIMQFVIVSLFFMLGFVLAWSYGTQTTPSSFAKPLHEHHNTQILQDVENLSKPKS
ncbi:MAG: hypothetical protein H6850_00765 [Alphaproteobacteria bacterium]|nr:MAG: hypothetical protein H6850_00765 [Alphaproteobacteria bacterium]